MSLAKLILNPPLFIPSQEQVKKPEGLVNDEASVVTQPFIEGPSKEPRDHCTAGDGKGLSAETPHPQSQERGRTEFQHHWLKPGFASTEAAL